MEIVKKNLISIICGVVAILAVAAVWPISGKFTELQQRVSARTGVYNQLNDLLKKERHLPLVSLQENATPDKLDQFPTEAVIAQGSQIKEKMKTQADELLKAAVALNKEGKKPLVPEALPNPRGAPVQLKFRQEYLKAMDYMSPDPAKRQASMPATIMKAGMKPTDEEMRAEIARQTKLITQQELAYDDKGRPVNQAAVNQKIQAMAASVPAQMRSEVAKKSVIYIDPDSLEQAPGMAPNAPAPSPPQIFWAQMGLWLQEDIARALADANHGSKDVTESAVKRLVKMTLPDQFGRIGITAQPVQPQPTEGDGAMAPMAPDPNQPIQKNYAISPTGRSTNPLYDVWTFKLQLEVEADRIPIVLQALSKNRFITIHELNMSAVDSGERLSAGYIYGPKPVMLLDMQVEALFLRDWTKPFMPRFVRTQLNVPEDQPQPAPG